MKLRDRFVRFMAGRYGYDKLTYALLVLYLVLTFTNYFINYYVITAICFGIVLVIIFRTFSKNLYRREQENRAFLKVWNPIEVFIRKMIRRLKEIRTHRYVKCSHCKATLRVPYKRGKHTIECPKCHHDTDVNIWL